MAEPVRPYTPETLAERWGCSPAHIRAMIRRGELPHFRLGGKLLGPEREYIKQAVTWVNGEGWADEYGAASAPISRPFSVDEKRAWLDRHGLMNAGKSAVLAKLRETGDEPRWTWER
jgi:excisionase family DNA binding protein